MATHLGKKQSYVLDRNLLLVALKPLVHHQFHVDAAV